VRELTMKQTTMGALIGLTSLLGGCDENKEIKLVGCDVGGLRVQATYHQKSGKVDYTTLDLYKDGKIVGSVVPKMRDWVQCDDGGKLNVTSGIPKVYYIPPRE